MTHSCQGVCGKMPKRPKISLETRRKWLKRYEDGEWYEDIARNDKVNPRTVREGVEKARLERDFEAAQREQLREALRDHQEDLLALVKRIQQTAQVMPLVLSGWEYGRDSGLEALEPPPKAEEELDVPIFLEGVRARTERLAQSNPPAIVKRDINGPREVVLTEEDTLVWRALKEHIGIKDSLWRHLAEWRNALLAEAHARAALNQIIMKKAEKPFTERALLPYMAKDSRLPPWLVSFIRDHVTRRALGNAVTDMADRLTVETGHVTGAAPSMILSERLHIVDNVKANMGGLVDAMVKGQEARHAADTYRNLEARSKKVKDDTEGYLLLHHIPGRCNLCKKLGGQ